MINILLFVSGIFYAVLCVFSIVTGIIYMSGKRELNPIELSKKMVSKLDTKEKKTKFAKTMGLVTFIVGIVQGITSFSIYNISNTICYFIALGFTIFSIGSVSFKIIKSSINTFTILKIISYVAILVILIISR